MASLFNICDVLWNAVEQNMGERSATPLSLKLEKIKISFLF